MTNIDPTLGRNIGPISCVTWAFTGDFCLYSCMQILWWDEFYESMLGTCAWLVQVYLGLLQLYFLTFYLCYIFVWTFGLKQITDRLIGWSQQITFVIVDAQTCSLINWTFCQWLVPVCCVLLCCDILCLYNPLKSTSCHYAERSRWYSVRSVHRAV